MHMYVRRCLEEQGCRQAKGCAQQATSDEEVQKAEGDQDCCAYCQAGLISQLLHPKETGSTACSTACSTLTEPLQQQLQSSYCLPSHILFSPDSCMTNASHSLQEKVDGRRLPLESQSCKKKFL